MYQLCTNKLYTHTTLNSSSKGCCNNGTVVNHLLYAYDICLMAPSPTGLQSIIDISAQFGEQNDVTFNANKSFCMVLKPTVFKVSRPI